MNRDEAVARLAQLTGLSVPTALELLDAAAGNFEQALTLFATQIIQIPIAREIIDSTPSVSLDPAVAAHFASTDCPRLEIPWLDALRKQAAGINDALFQCEQRGVLYTDPLFPANRSSLGACHGAAEVVVWRRPSEIEGGGEAVLFHDSASPSDVIQGRLQDCWLLGALALVAGKPGLLQRCLEFAWVHAGVYLLRFWVAGEWVPVVVDDQLPCDAAGRPVMGRCRDGRRVWVAVVEKGLAKLLGSYAALDGGSEDDALVLLTGGVPKVVELHQDEGRLLDGSTWNLLMSYQDRGDLLGCANHGTSATTGHIEPDHAYSVLGLFHIPPPLDLRLLHVRNPWGRYEWSGRYSRDSPMWDEVPPEVRRMIGFSTSAAGGEEEGPGRGSFFMCFEDFYTHFDRMYVCRLPPLSAPPPAVARGMWKGPSAGGTPPLASFVNNPQYRLMIDRPLTVRLRLIQVPPPETAVSAGSVAARGLRRLRSEERRHVGMYVLRLRGPEDARYALSSAATTESAIVCRSKVFYNAAEAVLKFAVEPPPGGGPAHYAVVPCTFRPGADGAFALLASAEPPPPGSAGARGGGEGLPRLRLEEMRERLAEVAVVGRWSGSEGGCMNQALWWRNHVFLLQLRGPGSYYLSLTLSIPRDGGGDDDDPTRGVGLGLYLFRTGAEGRPAPVNLLRQTAPFVLGADASLRLPGLPAGPYLVVPCTFRPGEHVGPFRLALVEEPPAQSGHGLPELSLLCDAAEAVPPATGSARAELAALTRAAAAAVRGMGGEGGGWDSPAGRRPFTGPPVRPMASIRAAVAAEAAAAEQEAMDLAMALSLSEASGGGGGGASGRR